MTSDALMPEKLSVRASRVAVSDSSVPSSALRRTSDESSCAVRAPDSSSFGSMPMSRRIALALLLSRRTAGRNTVVKAVWNGITNFATRYGSASARFFGSSSPTIIDRIVATRTPTM